MDFEEELFLANAEDSQVFFLADDENSSEDNERKTGFSEAKKEKQNPASNSSEIDEVYSLLKISEKPEKVDFKEYFKSNPEIFILAGVDYYQTLSEEQFALFEAKCDKLTRLANEKWRSPKTNYKIAELDSALGTLKSIFRTELSTIHYSNEIKRVLNQHLNSVLLQKIKDGILEISEIRELYEIAVSIHLIPDSKSGKKAILEWVKNSQGKKHFIIESYSETFLRTVKDKSEFDRLNTDICKQRLFEEYKSLAELNAQITGDGNPPPDSKLCSEMCNLLTNENLFVNNVTFYKTNFFETEKKNFRGNFLLPHTDEDFYYYKGTAKNLYQFTEEQWNEFVRLEDLKKDDSASLAFIMGTEKALTVAEIADLIEANSTMALSRILAGDVETYLIHIGQIDLAKRVSAIIEELKTDGEILVQSVANLLRGIDSSVTDNEEDEDKVRRTISALIEKDAGIKAIVSCLLSKKQYEKLNKKFLSSTSNEHTELESYLLSKGFSFIKLCVNYLNEFPEESNALAYKNMYENYAAYVLTNLSENADSNGAITFVCVFKPILEGASNKNLLSQNFMKKFSEIEKVMTEKLGEEENNFSKQQETKPKKSFFGFRK